MAADCIIQYRIINENSMFLFCQKIRVGNCHKLFNEFSCHNNKCIRFRYIYATYFLFQQFRKKCKNLKKFIYFKFGCISKTQHSSPSRCYTNRRYWYWWWNTLLLEKASNCWCSWYKTTRTIFIFIIFINFINFTFFHIEFAYSRIKANKLYRT